MFGDKKGLDANIKFAVASIYDGFSKKWTDFEHDKISWISTWSEVLASFSIDQINSALQHCINNVNKAPSVFEFKVYCNRAKNHEDMNAPYVTREEKIARRIIELSDELGCEGLNELKRACLIAASVAASRLNREVGIDWNRETIEIDFIGSAKMFAYESIEWTREAEDGSGYWKDYLKLEKQ